MAKVYISELSVGTASSGAVVLGNDSGGVTRKFQLAAANGIATLDSNGDVVQDLATPASISNLTDTTITGVGSGEVLQHNGSVWVNQTLSEAGISAVGHTHSYLPLSGGTLTGALSLSSGAIGTPSLAFSGDSDTGLYRDGADDFRLVANGAEGARVQAEGIRFTRGIAYGAGAWTREYITEGATDLSWRTVCTATIPSGTYNAAGWRVEVMNSYGNFAQNADDHKVLIYGASAVRSQAVEGDTDTGYVTGPSSSYVRLVRVDISTWELQLSQDSDYWDVYFKVTAIIPDTTSITYAWAETTVWSSVPTGSAGTTYTADTAPSSGGTIFASTRLRTGDGTVALPAYGFENDTDTGMYSQASNIVSFATGGSRRVAVMDASPWLRVDVSGTLYEVWHANNLPYTEGSWTPAWNNVTQGSGATNTGRYVRVGDIVHGTIELILGTGGSISGDVACTNLPYTSDTNFQTVMAGNARYEENGGNTYLGVGMVADGTNDIYCRVINAGSTYAIQSSLSNVIPFTWASGDRLRVSFTYKTSDA